MEWKREMTIVLYLLVVMATAAWASSREIAQELMDSSSSRGRTPGNRALKFIQNERLRKLIRCLNTGDDSCAGGYIPGAGDDDDYFNGGNTPGKRSHLNPVQKYILRVRCLNTGDDSCAGGYIPGAGDDDDYFNGGNTPGKRSSTMIRLNPLQKYIHRLRCLNTGDDSCAGGYVPGAGDDDGYFNGGNTPGKRCVNTGDDSCADGYVPGAGDDDGYFNGGNTPGKRCVNTGDDSCADGYVPGAGDDDGYFNGGNTPGKRSGIQYDIRRYCARFPTSPHCRKI